MGDYWMKFGENKTVNKVVVPPSPPTPVKKKTSEKQTTKEPKPKPPKTKNDTHTTPNHNLNPFNHLNNSGIKGFTGQNLAGNFQRTDTKDNVGGNEQHNKQLMVLYGLSVVGGFAALKVVSMIV